MVADNPNIHKPMPASLKECKVPRETSVALKGTKTSILKCNSLNRFYCRSCK